MAHQGRKHADESFLRALVCGATVENAAQSAGISKRTAHRRLKDPDFQRRRQALQTDLLQRTSAMLMAAGLEAVKTLLALQKEGMPPAVRLGAARAVVELGHKLRDHADFDQRLLALEAQRAATGADVPCGHGS